MTRDKVSDLRTKGILAFSAAHNNLSLIPCSTLKILNGTLKYLSLRGNDFGEAVHNFVKKDADHNFTFPIMENLLELDISDCNVTYLQERMFVNLKNLKRLILYKNRLKYLLIFSSNGLENLEYLDISWNNGYTKNNKNHVIHREKEGVTENLHDLLIFYKTFKYLKNLKYLYLTNTRLHPLSNDAFRYLSSKLIYLSLCNTYFISIPDGTFENLKNLRILDISSNPVAGVQITNDSFKGLENTLEILFFDDSNVKNLDWLMYLKNLKILKLSTNNINTLTNLTFWNLTKLQYLDLSSNHINSWTYRIFTRQTKMFTMNLRNNNINIITTEMLEDFSQLQFLALGGNNFFCNCLLRDMFDSVSKRNKNFTVLLKITKSSDKDLHPNDYEGFIQFLGHFYYYRDVEIEKENTKERWHLKFKEQNVNRKHYRQSGVENLRKLKNFPSMRLVNLNDSGLNGGKLPEVMFQLFDYNSNDYWCFNGSINFKFDDLEKCDDQKSYTNNADRFYKMSQYIIITIVLSILMGICTASLIYFKRWKIYYLLIVLKYSLIAKYDLKMNKKFIYDVFVSYCDKDREWIIQELIPNIEDKNIRVCLHERDFEVGVSILENIYSCMDKSRCILIVVSNDYLKSNWCQFEMNLAQYSFIQRNQGRLILVFLEDIPKRKRPKSLQHLMKIKTYLKWPATISIDSIFRSRTEEKKIFWIRLKRSLFDENKEQNQFI